MYISSEMYQQITPNQVEDIKRRIELCGKNSMYPFRTTGRPPVRIGKTIPDEVEIIEAYQVSYSNEQVLNLINKSIQIIQNTEEGVNRMLCELFLEKDKIKGIPPGTLRFYSQKHICFYTGKNWRKITP